MNDRPLPEAASPEVFPEGSALPVTRVEGPAPALAPSSPVGREYIKFVLVLGAISALGPLTIDMYLPALPAIGDDLSATDSQVQLTLTGVLVGMAAGQLVVGPLSDAIGRRRPLLAALVLHAVASLLCALAPSIEMLSLIRVLQGFAGAATLVVGLAIVRDLFDGLAMATLMSRLLLVMGVAPILAPTLGGQLLRFTSWRGVFLVVMAAGLLLAAMAYMLIPESLTKQRRRPARPRSVVATYASLLRDRTFMALVLMGGLMMCVLFAYISGAPFILQDGFGLSAQEFAVVFGLNAAVLIFSSQTNPLLIRRFPIVDVMTAAIVASFLAAALLVTTGLTGIGGLVGVVVPMVLVLACGGLTLPNTPTLALSRHGEAAGSAAAVLGFVQFGLGAVVAPLVGTFGSESATPMGVVMATAASLSALLSFFVVRRDMSVRRPLGQH